MVSDQLVRCHWQLRDVLRVCFGAVGTNHNIIRHMRLQFTFEEQSPQLEAEELVIELVSTQP